MRVKITKIINKGDYIIIYFIYNSLEKFTYLTNKSLIYWKKRGIKKICLGMEINVFRVPNSNNFKIIDFINKND